MVQSIRIFIKKQQSPTPEPPGDTMYEMGVSNEFWTILTGVDLWK